MPPKSKSPVLKKKLRAARKTVVAIEKQLRKEKLPKMPRIPHWILIRDFIRENGPGYTAKEIGEALEEHGHDMGAFPHRSVTSSVGHGAMGHIFQYTEQKDGRKTVSLTASAPSSLVTSFARPPLGRQAGA